MAHDAAADERFVFNIVWTGAVFEHLRPFTCTLLHHSRARLRFVANGATPASVAAMRAFQARHADRVVEVLDVSPGEMVRHGLALDAVRRARHDGDLFCLMDPDIKALGPFVPALAERLRDHAVATTGDEVWTDDRYVPEGHLGLAGEHVLGRDGFVYGCPHVAVYDRAALDDTCARWSIGFGSAGGSDVSEDLRARLDAHGHRYYLFDTGKLVNIALQMDGHRLCHFDHPALLHVGGMAHFLSPTGWVGGDGDGKATAGAGPTGGAATAGAGPAGGAASAGGAGDPEPDWSQWPGMSSRYAVARFAAATLRAAVDGQPPPGLPQGLEPPVAERLAWVRDEIVQMAGEHAGC